MLPRITVQIVSALPINGHYIVQPYLQGKTNAA